jgi:peptide/nickel transport system permease protein
MAVPAAVCRRVAFGLLAVYLVVSLAFVVVAVPPDPQVAYIKHQLYQNGASEADVEYAVAQYRASRNLGAPLPERYVSWLAGVVTLDWGWSYSHEASVTAVLGRALPYTAAYLAPAGLVATVGGVALGWYAATNRRSVGDRLAGAVAHLGVGLPDFWLAQALLLALAAPAGAADLGFDPTAGALAPANLAVLALPAAVLSVTLLSAQYRYTRTELLEHAGTDVAKLVRAKGGGTRRVGRHLLRLAAVPLLTVTVTELLGVLVLNVYVLEYVFGVPGLGQVTLAAIQDRDVPLVVGSALVVALVGVGGSTAQDVAQALLDPRDG